MVVGNATHARMLDAWSIWPEIAREGQEVVNA